MGSNYNIILISMTILKVAVNSLLICLSFSCVSCQMKPEDKTNSDKVKQLVNTSLLDKSLPEIKDLVKGKCISLYIYRIGWICFIESIH